MSESSGYATSWYALIVNTSVLVKQMTAKEASAGFEAGSWEMMKSFASEEEARAHARLWAVRLKHVFGEDV